MAALGRGGMGQVYRARHRDTGRVVALKTVNLLDPLRIASIRREVRALAQLRHRGVVPILDDGVDDGVPWYAMELVEGTSLRQLLDGDRDGAADPPERTVTHTGVTPTRAPALAPARSPLPLPEALALGARIAEALGHLHGKGLLHRDLKPSNVLLRATGDVVLIDFGLTVLVEAEQSRERLDVGAERLGTPGYMAPEQRRGEDLDARTDLYALGCVLFEMLTARPPSGGHDDRHPSRHVAGLPSAVDALVASLLDPDASSRPGDALEIAARCAELGGVTREAPTAAPPVTLGRARFVGRDRMIARVEAALLPGAIVGVGGESGLGKTRLAREVARRALGAGGLVFAGECRAPGGRVEAGATALGGVLHAFAEPLVAVADHVRSSAADEAEVYAEPLRVLAACIPELAPAPGGASVEVDRLSPVAARRRVVEALHAVLTRFAARRPLLVVLDDLQWADDLSLLYLEMRERGELEPTTVRLLVTYRQEEAPPRLRALVTAAPARYLALERLSEDEMLRLAGSMLFQSRCPEDLGRFLCERTGGNPYFLSEYLRAAVAEGWLRRGAGAALRFSAGATDPSADPTSRFTPESVRGLSRRRLQGIAPAAMELARCAAVLGRNCDASVLQSTAGADDAVALEGLAELVASQVLEEVAAGRYRFVHDQLRELVYQDLDADTRRRTHATAAAVLESATSHVGATDHRAIAHHLLESSQVARACEHLLRASDAAFASGAYLQTTADIEAVLRHGETRWAGAIAPGTLAALHRRLSQSYMYAGDVDACARHSAAALAALSLRVPRSRVGWRGLLGREAASQAAHLAFPQDPPRAEGDAGLADAALAAGNLGRSSFFRNDAFQMIACGLWAVNLAEKAGAFTDAARNYGGLGFTAGALGAARLADRYFERARRVGQDDADWPGLAFSLCSEGVFRAGRAEWSALRRAIGLALEVCHRTGDPQDTDLARVILGHADHYQGRLDAAVAAYDDVLAQARRRHNRQTIAWALYCGARSRAALGQHREACAALDEAATLARAVGDEMSIVAALGLRALLETAQDALDEAATVVDELRARLKTTSPTVFLIGYGYEGVAAFELARLGRRGSVPTAARALLAFEATARQFPVFRPAALRLRSRLLAWVGATERARACLAEADRVAIAQESATGLDLPG